MCRWKRGERVEEERNGLKSGCCGVAASGRRERERRGEMTNPRERVRGREVEKGLRMT